VARHDREIVAALRAEVGALEPARPCDRRAELAGIGDVTARDPVVARIVHRLNRDARAAAEPPFGWDDAAEHCRTAYLRGRFLAAGSLSLANGRTHLEFVIPVVEAQRLARQLGDVGLPASWRLRRDRGVVTWKGQDVVGTFLRRIGAGPTLLEVEARQVARAMRGQMNRILNAESANLGRIVAAAGRQLAAIEALAADGRLTREPYAVRVVADARRETPEATLGELAERLGFHRSAVQRALDRMVRLASGGSDGTPLA